MTSWLIDKSALVRLGESVDAALGSVARLSWPCLSNTCTPEIEDRAVEVRLLLADQGHHRAPSIPDLIIAAIAERAGLTVLHFDKEFGLVAAVTGQPIERLVV